MADDAAATLEAAGDDWGIAASSLIRATGAAHAGDVSTVAAMAETVRRITRTRSTTTRFASRACCSTRGWQSDGRKAPPR